MHDFLCFEDVELLFVSSNFFALVKLLLEVEATGEASAHARRPHVH